MKRLAVSVRQPEASLLLAGYTQYHARAWTTNVRGPVLIHAAEAANEQLAWILAREDVKRAFRLAGIPLFASPAEMPCKQIVGVATLVDTVTAGSLFDPSLMRPVREADAVLGNLARADAVLWKFTRPAYRPTGVSQRGGPGLWEVEDPYGETACHTSPRSTSRSSPSPP